MKKLALCLLLILAGYFAAEAQSPADTTRKHNLYVSTNVLPILQSVFNSNANTLSNYDLILFKEPILQQGLSGYRSRLGLALNTSFNRTNHHTTDTTMYPTPDDHQDTYYLSLDFSAAREKVWLVPYRFKLGIGPIVGARYSYLQSQFSLYYSNTNTSQENTIYNQAFGVYGGIVASAYWQACPWLMVGADTRLALNVNGSFSKTTGYNSPGGELHTRSLGAGINYSPLYRLSACIRIR